MNDSDEYWGRLAEKALKNGFLGDPEPAAAECRRQSLIIRNDPYEMHDLDMLAEIADWDKE